MIDVLLLYRNSNYGKPGTSILGLGVNAYHTVKILTQLGYAATAKAVWLLADIKNYFSTLTTPPKYCIIEAPWLSVTDTVNLTQLYPTTHFYVRCHSNVGFLQIEAGAIDILRELLLYSESLLNLSVAANSLNFCKFINQAYHAHCAYLPNLYYAERVATKRWLPFASSTLRTGSFGAIRLQKNHITGAAAALLLARELGTKLEFYLTVNRTEGPGAAGVTQAIKNLFVNLTWANLITVEWASWPIFRRTIADMHLCFHLSVTETFSLSTADALAESVPVVGSEVIDWLPHRWKVSNLDNPLEAAAVGKALLYDHNVPTTAASTLQSVCTQHEAIWQNVLR